MGRTTKKAIYGIFYFITLLIIVYAFLGDDIARPTCFDGLKNQDEINIDCGGICGACEGGQIKQLTVSTHPRLFRALDEVRVIFGVKNSNVQLGAEFSYEVYSTGSEALLYKGLASVRALEDKLVYVAALPKQFLDKEKVQIRITGARFRSDQTAARPKVIIVGPISTNISGEGGYVKALVRNEGVVTASRVEVIAVLLNQYSTPIFPGYTFIDDLLPQETREVAVVFPALREDLSVSASTTQIYLSPL